MCQLMPVDKGRTTLWYLPKENFNPRAMMPQSVVLLVPKKRSRTLPGHLPGERCTVLGNEGYWGCIFEVLAPQGLVAPHYCGRSLWEWCLWPLLVVVPAPRPRGCCGVWTGGTAPPCLRADKRCSCHRHRHTLAHMLDASFTCWKMASYANSCQNEMKTQDVQRKDLPSTHKLGETQLLVLEDLQNYRLIKKYQTLAP